MLEKSNRVGRSSVDKSAGRRNAAMLLRVSSLVILLALAAMLGVRSAGAAAGPMTSAFGFFSSSESAWMSPKIAAVNLTPLNNTITGPCPGAGCSAAYTVTVFRGTAGGSGGAFVADLATIGTLPQGVTAMFASNSLIFNAPDTQQSTTVTYTADATAINGVYGINIRATVNGDPTDFAESVNNTLTITAVCDVPVVMTNPTNQSVVYGNNATFTAANTGTSPTPSTQWQLSTDGGMSWNDIAMATGSSYTVVHPTVAMTGRQYRAHYTAPCGNTFTTAATLTVDKKNVTASVTASNKTYDGNTTATITGCTVNSLEMGDTVTCTANGPNTFDNPNAGTGKTVTANNIVLGGPDAANYMLMAPLPPPPAGSRYVATTGSDAANNCLTSGTPCATIQYAVGQANPGEMIVVAAGTYNESVSINKALSLRGAKAGVDGRSRSGAETVVTTPVSTSPQFTVAVSGLFSIDGFTFSGGPTGASGCIFNSTGPNNGMQIVNNRFVNYPAAAIWLNRSGLDVTIDKNLLDGGNISGSGQAIFLNTQSFNGLFVTNNSIVNNAGRYGLFVDGSHNVGESATRAPAISGNVFNSNLQGLNLGSRSFGTLAAPVLGSYGGYIQNNTFSNHSANGIQGGIQHVLVSGNTFTNNTLSGIALTSFGNTGADRGGQFSVLTGNCFTGNATTQPNQAAIFFSSTQGAGTISTNVANQNNIAGNTVGVQYGTAASPGSETVNAINNYWGSATGPTNAGNPGGTGDPVVTNGSGAITFAPFLASVVTCPPPPAAGSYSATTTADILKAPLSVQASSHTVTYGDAAPSVMPSYTGFVNGENSGVIDTPPSCVTAYLQGSSVAGSPYQTSCSGGLDNNYFFNAYNTGTVTVNRLAFSASAGGGSTTYDGMPHSPSACQLSPANPYPGGLSCTNNPASVGPNANNGTPYTIAPVVNYNGGDSNNYQVTSNNNTYTINKANANCVVNGYNVQYDGISHTATGQCTGVAGGGGGNYTIASTTGTIVPGTTDIGIHCDDCTTSVALPFSIPFYDQTFTSMTVSSNGAIGFSGITSTTGSCIVTGSGTNVMAAYWDDLVTVDTGAGNGIFTSTTGMAPNRVFNIEWRARHYPNFSGSPDVYFEVRLHENTPDFEVVYADSAGENGSNAGAGVQRDTGSLFTNFSCDSPGSLPNGLQLNYTIGGSPVLSGLDLSATTHTHVINSNDPWTFTDGTGNYNNTSGMVNDTITKADANCAISGYGPSGYDANPHGASGTCTGVNGEVIPTIGTLNLGAQYTDVPGGTATWAFTGGQDYNNQGGSVGIQITKINANCSISGYGPAAYDGNPHGAMGTCTGINGEMIPTIGSLNLGAQFTDFPGGTANWTFTGGTNYNNDGGSVPIQIDKANANCSISGYGPLPYDGMSHGATGTCTGVNGETIPTIGSLNLGSSFTDFPGGTANWTFTGTNNYNNAGGSVPIQIDKADANCGSIVGFTGTYDKMPHGATGTCTGVNGEVIPTIGTLNLGSSFTNVPGGTANWTFTGTNNYNNTGGSVSITINARPITVTANPGQAKIFGMVDPLPFTYSVTSGSLASGDNFTGALSRTAGESPGTYPITIGTLAISDGNSGNNYNLTYVSNNFTINPCPVVSTASQSAKTNTFIDIPVTTTTTTGGNIISADFWLNYDPMVLSSNPADISATIGTVPPGSTTMTVGTATAGVVKVSFFVPDSSVFMGAGTLATLHMKTIGPIGSSSGLTLSNVKYNNNLICSSSTSGTINIIAGSISGRVTYENNPAPTPVPVQGTTLTGAGSAPTIVSVTDFTGNYSMSGFGFGSYTVTPTRPDENCNNGNGIFANDASLIAQYVVGLANLNSVQLRAADVAGLGTGNISSYEAALIARYTVCLATPGSQVGQWKFSPVNRVYPDVNADQPSQNYLALLMGDVTGDWMPSMAPPRPGRVMLERPMPDSITVSLPRVAAPSGTTVEVPLRIGSLGSVGVKSYQFDVQYDASVVEPADVAADLTGTMSQGMSVVSNSPERGLLKVTVYGAIPVNGDGVYVNLRLNTIGGKGTLSPLTITQFILNDAQTRVFAQDGLIKITAAASPSLRGRLLTADGSPVVTAQVSVTQASAAGQRGVTVSSDAEGRFVVNNLVVGQTYTLTVNSRSYAFRPITVAITDQIVELDMIAEP
jgi:hypothetical protein